MVDFLKFMLKCLWQGSSYVFSAGSAGEKTQEPIDILGIAGFGVLVASFFLIYWLLEKFESSCLCTIIILLISLVIVIVYFLIAFCFVR